MDYILIEDAKSFFEGVRFNYEDIPIDKRYEVGEIVSYFVEISEDISEEIRAKIIGKCKNKGKRYIIVEEIESGSVKLVRIDKGKYLFNETKEKKGYWY